MTERQKILAIALVLIAIIGIIFMLTLPSGTTSTNVDFTIRDSNRNYHYEVGEPLTFSVNSPETVKGGVLLWQFGNGDSIVNKSETRYIFKKSGKYLISLTLNGHLLSSRYIQIVPSTNLAPIDSIPKINAVEVAYQDEEITFHGEGPGANTWQWSFGESGTVDAYEQQVKYKYETPGEYIVELQTNTTKYPIRHKIKILPRFEKVEEMVTVDSLSLAQDDIKRRLQIIANLSVRDVGRYKEQVNYIRTTYFCISADRVAVVVNGDKYNDFLGYCQGLHFLESNSKRRILIQDVKLDNPKCVTTIQVTQKVEEK